MVRSSKQERKRNMSPRKHRAPSEKTGSKKAVGFREHANAVQGASAETYFIPKIK